MKRILIFTLVVITALAAMAQMTLRDCLIYARDNCPDNVIERYGIEISKADARIAASRLMPGVSLYSNSQFSFGRNIDPETNIYDNKQTLNAGVGLQLSMPLFDGLVNINALKSARTARLRKNEAARSVQDRISFEVIKAFYNVVYCRAMVKQAREQLKRDSTDMAGIALGRELGTKSGADLAEISAIVAADRYEEINQMNLLDKAYLELRHLMGMSLDTAPLDLTEDDVNQSTVTTNDFFVHPDIAEATFALKEEVYNLRSAIGSFSPTINLQAGINTSYYKMLGNNTSVPSFSSQWHNNMGQYVGLSFSFTLFDGLYNTSRLRRAKANLAMSRAKLEKTTYEVERAMLQAQLDAEASEAEYDAACHRLDAEETAYRATHKKFELGSASAIDLYTSGAKLSIAKANCEGKRIQLIISRITLDYYNGKPLIND